MSISSLGPIDLFAETGEDQWELLKKVVREAVERKKLRPGQRQIMRVNFDKELLVEIIVRESPIREEAK